MRRRRHRRSGYEETLASANALPFVSETAYVHRSGGTPKVLFEAENVRCRPMPVFPAPEPGFYDFGDTGYAFPAVTLTTLRDVLVRGRSNLLTARDAILGHDLLDLATDVPAEEFEGRLRLLEVEGLAQWAAGDPFNVDYLPEAAAFTDGAAWNYAHWMTEVLPRAAAFLGANLHVGIPLIVDVDLHPNLMRSIELLAPPDTPIYRLGRDHLVRVGVLHNVSPTAYARYKPRGQTRSAIAHGVFSTRALSRMVDDVRAAANVGAEPGDRPKLFLHRSSSLRQLVNQADVEQALVARGFTVVETERLTFDEQVALFSRARMVVGGTGAAIANLLFCRPDCPVVTLVPRTSEVGYWYWRNIAAATGAPVVSVTGELQRLADAPSNRLLGDGPYRIETADLLDALAATERLCPPDASARG
jgi:hypothetical protein